MNDDRFSTLYDHYKDSFALILGSERQRDRLFLWVVAILGILFLEIGYPTNVRTSVQEIAGVKVNAAALPWLPIVSATWVVLLATAVRYFQLCVNIDRKYDYLHDLEARLAEWYGEDGTSGRQYRIFTREGEAYVKDYPFASDLVWFLYVLLFPTLAIIAVIRLLWMEKHSSGITTGHLWFDGAVIAILIAIIFSYRFPKLWFRTRSFSTWNHLKSRWKRAAKVRPHAPSSNELVLTSISASTSDENDRCHESAPR